MRKSLLSALVASVWTIGAAQAALTFDSNGILGGGVIQVSSFDWTTTSFLAKGGATAIRNFDNGLSGADLEFDVITHARLIGYKDQNGATQQLPSGIGEITMVGSFREKVTATSGGNRAEFETVGSGWLEMYSSSVNSVDVSGSGFDDGRVIMRATGVDLSTGDFSVTLDRTTGSPILANLDGFNGDSYAGQQSVQGRGGQDIITFGTTSTVLDPNYFNTALAAFSILFENISIGLPYKSADPSDCFNIAQSSATPGQISSGIGNVNSTVQCQNNHNSTADMSGQAADGGYLPVIGLVNGLDIAGTSDPLDFVAQTDFNSPVTGAVPEPGMLALLGLALGALGITSARRRA